MVERKLHREVWGVQTWVYFNLDWTAPVEPALKKRGWIMLSPEVPYTNIQKNHFCESLFCGLNNLHLSH